MKQRLKMESSSSRDHWRRQDKEILERASTAVGATNVTPSTSYLSLNPNSWGLRLHPSLKLTSLMVVSFIRVLDVYESVLGRLQEKSGSRRCSSRAGISPQRSGKGNSESQIASEIHTCELRKRGGERSSWSFCLRERRVLSLLRDIFTATAIRKSIT